MDVMDAIHARRAVRDYSARPVEAPVLDELIEAATWAPSGMDRQPWIFYVVDDRALLAAFSPKAKAMMLAGAAVGSAPGHLIELLGSPGFDIFYNAPVLVLICAATPDEMAMKDCCLAAQNLMLAARARGLGSCWIGFAEAWLQTAEARADLGLRPDIRPVAPIILGHPSAFPPPPVRRPAVVRHVAGPAA